MSAVLELDNIIGGYGETQILHGVSLSVGKGEIVAIIGPNGAGKSTAMKAVFGLLRLSSGKVRLDGQDITNTPPDRWSRRGVCYVPQTSNMFPTLTVEENLEMGAYVRNDDIRPRLARSTRCSRRSWKSAARSPARSPAGSARWWPWARP